ncbi:MAG: DUF3574 domain-containing protein [Opitutaceae bacterium]|nr:DUF3574 domain-containing protein [Opitutaceae bacterium]
MALPLRHLPAPGQGPKPTRSLRVRFLASVLLAGASLAGCTTPRTAVPAANNPPAALQGDSQRPALARWLRTELYLAVGRVDAPGASLNETGWRAFLDREVTPRFPDGFSVVDAYGQWLDRTRPEPGRLLSKVIVILHEDTPARAADIDAIRVAWKRQTGAQSVLRASSPVDVSF